jgi:hypothetical protein
MYQLWLVVVLCRDLTKKQDIESGGITLLSQVPDRHFKLEKQALRAGTMSPLASLVLIKNKAVFGIPGMFFPDVYLSICFLFLNFHENNTCT